MTSFWEFLLCFRFQARAQIAFFGTWSSGEPPGYIILLGGYPIFGWDWAAGRWAPCGFFGICSPQSYSFLFVICLDYFEIFQNRAAGLKIRIFSRLFWILVAKNFSKASQILLSQKLSCADSYQDTQTSKQLASTSTCLKSTYWKYLLARCFYADVLALEK